jgi:uncharacterized membrane protein
MLYAGLKTLHLLSIIVWVGGMIFAHCFLRPAVANLEPPTRLRLMHSVLGRFFGVVLPASLLVLGTGLWMIGNIAKATVQAGGSFTMPLHWSVMSTTGLLMVVIFLVIRFVLYRRFDQRIRSADWAAAGTALGHIRQWVLVNLLLGLFTVIFTLMYAGA